MREAKKKLNSVDKTLGKTVDKKRAAHRLPFFVFANYRPCEGMAVSQ